MMWARIYFTDFIHSVCFVLAEAAGLKIKLAKQINHMMRRLADCCFFSPFILLAFFPSFSSFFLKLQLSRHEGPCGPDQMFQAAHFPTLCLMEYSWATRHRSTAPHRPETTYLFIYFLTLLPGCLMHNNSSTCKSIFSPSCFSHSHSPHPFPFHWQGSPGYINMPYSISVGILMDHHLSTFLLPCC